jgi:hypothetical protein
MGDTIDRYPTDPTDPNKQFREELRELQRRIGELEGRAPLGHTTLREGRVIFTNANGDPLVVIGQQDDGTYGLWMFDNSGNVVQKFRSSGQDTYDAAGNRILNLSDVGLSMYDAAGQLRSRVGLTGISKYGVTVRDAAAGMRFWVDDDGHHDPWLAHPWRGVPTPARQSTASGSFTDLWSSRIDLITHLGVACWAAWVVDSGVSGEVRLRSSIGATTTAVAISGTSGSQQFKWLHDATLGTGPVSFYLQARVTGGAGSVHLDQPFTGAQMADPDNCDADGIP